MSAVCVWLTDDHRRGHHLRGRSCHAGGEVDPRGGRRGTAGQGRTEAAGPRGAQGVRATDARGAQHGVRHGQDGDGHRQPAAGDADLAGGRRCVRALFPPSLSPLALFALHSQGNGVQRSATECIVSLCRMQQGPDVCIAVAQLPRAVSYAAGGNGYPTKPSLGSSTPSGEWDCSAESVRQRSDTPGSHTHTMSHQWLRMSKLTGLSTPRA